MIESVSVAQSLDELFGLVSANEGRVRILAGGTDLLLQNPGGNDAGVTLIDVTPIPEFRATEETNDGVRIGAVVRLSEVMRSEVMQRRFSAVVQGARDVAGPQIRNLATLVGNVCNASPSADTVPPLLVHDTTVEISSADSQRTVPLDEFFTGPGQTVLEKGEIVTSLVMPWPAEGHRASYTKVSPRRAMDLAVVGVAVGVASPASGLDVRIALGAVAPTPLRARAAEDYVAGEGRIDEAVAAEAGRLAQEAVSPIDDVRGSARYRRAMVRRVVTRDLLSLADSRSEAVA